VRQLLIMRLEILNPSKGFLWKGNEGDSKSERRDLNLSFRHLRQFGEFFHHRCSLTELRDGRGGKGYPSIDNLFPPIALHRGTVSRGKKIDVSEEDRRGQCRVSDVWKKDVCSFDVSPASRRRIANLFGVAHKELEQLSVAFVADPENAEGEDHIETDNIDGNNGLLVTCGTWPTLERY
jgi:hypothetical protein